MPLPTHPSLLFRSLWVALAVIGLALSSQVTISMNPVPMTLQTLAVVLTGFLLGTRFGSLATFLWLGLGAAGAPVFAEGAGGLEHLTGPTAGYLWSFPFAAALAGIGANSGRKTVTWLFVFALAAHLIILAMGASWLAAKIGAQAALSKGVMPFLPGAALKSAVAAALFRLIRGLRRARDREAAPDQCRDGASSH
ncbi:biotin transporter BioY [Sphingomonas hankyongi]|uniref:Biotin transporter n=1 Tax=Sphingomonas hankyongi TaxID=2908209 RepID=A0ABT0S145_9SPHN|nr:biotin transporter BioY [Sphingomonas hankyongi]